MDSLNRNDPRNKITELMFSSGSVENLSLDSIIFRSLMVKFCGKVSRDNTADIPKELLSKSPLGMYN